MTISYATATRNAKMDAITTQISTSGLIRIYSGTPPADCNTALSGNTQLAELACSSTFAGSAASGVLTANSITADSSADATGTATFFRVLTSGGTAKIQGTVGTSGTDMIIKSTAIASGAQVSISSFVLTSGNA